jgi:hypothetical protein
MPRQRLPQLPALIKRKLYKTGQTRGADDDVIYQNRVARNSTVLIPYGCWNSCAVPANNDPTYNNGFIVLVSPSDYFGQPNITSELDEQGLTLGENTLVLYETREQWNANSPDALSWSPANRRTNPLGGQYVARVPATTAAGGGRIVRGFSATSMKGAGIRVYEYASRDTIRKCRLQLEALFWLCRDSDQVAIANGMTRESATIRKAAILAECQESGLSDQRILIESRILNADGKTVCPLCLEELSGQGFFNRLEQAEGRVVPDLTVTQLNLFHIEELRYGALGHRPYNVGWGHHHCNVVTKDSGIVKTIEWMRDVINRNVQQGHFPAWNSAI